MVTRARVEIPQVPTSWYTSPQSSLDGVSSSGLNPSLLASFPSLPHSPTPLLVLPRVTSK